MRESPARRAKAKRSSLKVLFTSGFPGTSLTNGAVLDEDDVLLSKPYRKDELAGAVYEALAQDGQRAPPIDPQLEGDALGTPTKHGLP